MADKIKFARTTSNPKLYNEEIVIKTLLRKKQEEISEELNRCKVHGNNRLILLRNKAFLNALYSRFVNEKPSLKTLDPESTDTLIEILKEAVVDNFTKSLNNETTEEDKMLYNSTMDLFKTLTS